MNYEPSETLLDDWIVAGGGSMYDLEERLPEFSAQVIQLTEGMNPSVAGRHIAGQLIRSSTSPLANHGEAQAAESSKGFIHKLKLSLKELRETFRWLKLVKRVPFPNKPESLYKILEETDQLIRILVASIKTARQRSKYR